MRTTITCILFAMLGVLTTLSSAQAQEISGFSTMSAVNVCTGLGCTRRGGSKTYVLQESAYVDTEEDYTAALYYNCVEHFRDVLCGKSNTVGQWRGYRQSVCIRQL